MPLLEIKADELAARRLRLKRENRKLFVRRFLVNKAAVTGSVLIALVAAVSLFAPWIASRDPYAIDVVNRLKAPSAIYPFGTDNFGRDLLTRVVYGTRMSAEVGFAVALGSSAIGLVIGLYAGYFKWLDQILMRVMDGLFAFPAVLLAIAMMAALGPSVGNLILCLIIVFVPSIARIVRSSVLTAKETTYIEAMHTLGASHNRIIWKHILPGSLSTLIVQGSFIFAEAIIVEAALSFLGAGIPAPTPSLGNLLSDGKLYIYNSSWMTLFPGLALVLVVLAMNLFGDGLRDLLDPHARRSLTKRLVQPLKQRPAPFQAGSAAADEPLLQIRELKTQLHTERGRVPAVDGVSFEVGKGEVVGIVGESGCGKSATAQSVLRLFDEKRLAEYEGEIRYNGIDLLKLTPKQMRSVRGNEISMIFQDPLSSLNPVHTIGEQIVETLRLHRPIGKKEAWTKALELLRLTGIPAPERRAREYPHQLSGGMRQRVMIAIALACEPQLLIADEPTTALDVTIQAQILELILDLNRRMGMSVMLITHDLGVVAEACSRVVVMYLGQVVESGDVRTLFEKPLHPYTIGLMQSVPRLDGDRSQELAAVPGSVPSLDQLPQGCRFAPRCTYADDKCRTVMPELAALPGGDTLVRCWHAGKLSGMEA